MRVLSVSAFIDPVTGGGTAERTVQLARAMARAGMDVDVLATDAGLPSSRRGVDVGRAHLELLSCRNERFLVPRVTLSHLERRVKQADIVHLCTHWTILNLLVYRAAWRVGKPYVVCPAGALPIFGRSRLLKLGYNVFGGKRLVSRASGWIAITQREREDFREYGVDPARIDVVPNGIEPGDFQDGDPGAFRSKFDLQDRRLILFMGRLNQIKGPDLLLDAFISQASKLTEWTLVYAGPDAGMRTSLAQCAQEAGLSDRVRFVGWLGGSDKVAAYRAAELVVVPSRQEAMSLVALEAGACGRPVLMTDRCGFDEATRSGGALAVPPAAEPLAAALRDLLLKAPLDQMGVKLRDLIFRDYSWSAAVRRYEEIFRRILLQSRP